MRRGIITFARGTAVVEIAETDFERQTGLSGRMQLAPSTGMVFDFGSTAPRQMWMRATFVSLDMIFITEGGSVVGLVENVPPCTNDPRGGWNVRYVLEVPAGWARVHGVTVGAYAQLIRS